jgi:hypothetical protein
MNMASFCFASIVPAKICTEVTVVSTYVYEGFLGVEDADT